MSIAGAIKRSRAIGLCSATALFAALFVPMFSAGGEYVFITDIHFPTVLIWHATGVCGYYLFLVTGYLRLTFIYGSALFVLDGVGLVRSVMDVHDVHGEVFFSVGALALVIGLGLLIWHLRTMAVVMFEIHEGTMRARWALGYALKRALEGKESLEYEEWKKQYSQKEIDRNDDLTDR